MFLEEISHGGSTEENTYTAAEVAELQTTIQQQQAEIDALKKKLDHMNEILINAQRARFGQSSEKKTYVLGEDQICLFNEAEQVQNHKAEEPTEETFTVKAHARKKKRTIDELAKSLPVEEIVLQLPDSKLNCNKCSAMFRLIGKKLVRRELIIIPQEEKILEYYSCTYACDRCEKNTGFAHILTTQAPAALMKHSLASPSTVADVTLQRGFSCRLRDNSPSDQEVCGRTSVGPVREDLGQTGRGVEPCYTGQLGDSVCPNLAETSIPTYEAGLVGRYRNSCG